MGFGYRTRSSVIFFPVCQCLNQSTGNSGSVSATFAADAVAPPGNAEGGRDESLIDSEKFAENDNTSMEYQQDN